MDKIVFDLKKEFPALTSEQTPTLTCYIPQTQTIAGDRLNPAILICAGGGYYHVYYDREGDPFAFNFLGMSYAAFVLDYSIAPVTYPQQLLEASAAMAIIRRNAKEWKIDADKIAVMGFSAGGHLAASLGTLWHEPFIISALKLKYGENKPNALVLSYPVISADPACSHAESFECLLGTKYSEDNELFKKLSLENAVSEKTPPTYLWHTFEDTCVPVENSLRFSLALAKNNVPFELHVFPYGCHGLATANRATNPPESDRYNYCEVWLSEVQKWFNSMWHNR